LERPEVDRESTALGSRLAELERQNLAMQKIESDRTALEFQEIQVSMVALDLRVEAQQRAIADAETLSPVLEKRLATERLLRKEGLTPAVSNAAIEAEQAYLQNESRLKELKADVSRSDFERAQLETSRKRLAQDVLERASTRRNEIDALRAQLEVLDARTDATGVVRSEHDGRVVELLLSEGQLVTTGARIALIETAGRSPALTCLAYLPIRDGKRVRTGMAVQVTPDMVSRERFGGILGTVESVSTFPVTREAVAVTVGSRDVAEHVTTAEPHIEIVIALASDPTTASGYRWSSSTGPPLKLSAGTTAAIRVTVEERAPITFLLPFLRSVTGVY
jgi:HlyD family secretion protein